MTENRSVIAWRQRGRRDYRGHLGTLRYVHHLNCADGFIGVYICQNLIVCFEHVQFTVCQLYPNKAVEKN